MSGGAGRRFPAVGWCWPEGGRDVLLRAALDPDPAQAMAALQGWLGQHRIDDLGFAEHRLLAAIFARFGRAITDPEAAGRMAGLQRQIWTQSRLRVHAVLPALADLQAAGIEVMLLKGAARIALHPEVERSRAHQDVDILVRPEQIAEAAARLAAAGWQSARGDSALAAVARAPGARAINFQKLPFGDIDLHRTPYHGEAARRADLAALWAHARPASYFGLPVLVPDAAERLALALAHGAWSPEAHSDWLVDAADILARDAVDWPRFLQIVAARRLADQVRIGLGYLAEVTASPLPPEVERLLQGRSGWASLLIGRDPARLGRPLRLLRGICYGLLHRDRSGAARDGSPLVLAWARPRPAPAPGAGLGAGLGAVPDLRLQHPLALPAASGPVRLRLRVLLQMPGPARRIEMELNSATANLARLRLLARPVGAGWMEARITLRLDLPEGAALVLGAVPSKLLAPGAAADLQARYGAVPFAITDLRLSRP